MQRVTVRLPQRKQQYDVIIGSGTLVGLGKLARRTLGPSPRRIVLISNRKVFGLYGVTASDSLNAAGFTVSKWMMGDGERFKSLATLEQALAFLSRVNLERSDAVIALGGGVVGDLAGFAAALYLRGIKFIQVPTTLLAQIDASVGGKTAVNTTTGKNLMGAFHHPRAVLIDTSTLRTLPARELTAGWCECIKHGAAGSRNLFEKTFRSLGEGYGSISTERARRIVALIAAHVAFKASIVAGDEREEVSRTDPSSRRILNLGHTVGHALEAATGYRRLLHGEAVGYGMLVAGEISTRLGLLDASELELLREAVRRCGRFPPMHNLNERDVLRRIRHDKKASGGQLKWVLLESIGRARIVDGREIGPAVLRVSLRAGLEGLPEK
ncbi:MAG: 3-dehydroquinate synthase [Acidobacteriota bacterium]|nr:3-dehydroquinate synthase [Acidobacteriota bacterium]